jgi:hypothetical protein
MRRTTRHMSGRHEADVAEALGGRLTRGSGCTAQDPTDVVSLATDEFDWAADCKSTLAKSLSVTVATWNKLEKQADGRIALLPLRCYADDRLTYPAMDLVALSLEELADLLYWARMGKRSLRVFDEEAPLLAAAARAVRHETEHPLGALQRVAEAMELPLPDDPGGD